MAEEYKQLNIAITSEDTNMLDVMMREDGYEKQAPFVRRLIRQEYARRYSKPSPVKLAEAIEAGKAINPMVTETD